MNYYNEPRVVGPFLPFVGGLLVGGLFAPTKGPLYPNYQQGPVYYTPVPYYYQIHNQPYSTNQTYNYQPTYQNQIPNQYGAQQYSTQPYGSSQYNNQPYPKTEYSNPQYTNPYYPNLND